jgi:GT2 family glycosyltransferase
LTVGRSPLSTSGGVDALSAEPRPLVSLVVLNYNGKSSIGECLESIRDQSYPGLEVIVVDNASSDGSPELVERLFPKARLIRNPSNLGFAEGNNVGIREARGEFIVLVNNDLVLERDAIKNLVENMSPGVGILGGVVYYYHGHDVWAYGGYLEPLSGVHWHNLQGAKEGEPLPTRLAVDYVPGALLMMRRSVLQKVGLIGSNFFLYADDIDLACKVKRLGYTVEVVSSSKSYHIVSQSIRAIESKDASRRLRGFYMMNRNMFHVYFAQFPLAMAVSASLCQLGLSLFEVLLFGRKLLYATTKVAALAGALGDLAASGGEERRRLRALGKLPLRPNVRTLIRTARSRGASRVYYW